METANTNIFKTSLIIMRVILLFTVFIYNLSCVNCMSIEFLPYNDPNSCNNSEKFNVNSLKCQICDINKNLVPSSNKQSCVCNEKSRPIFDASTKLSTPRCEKCKADSVFSNYINSCIKCTNGFVKKNNITSCKPCRDNEIMVQQFTNGTFLSQTRCIPCTNGMTPSKDGTRCIPCSIYNPILNNGTFKCICDYKSVLIGNICIPRNIFPLVSNVKIKYYLQYHTGEVIESKLFDSQLKLNGYLCKLENATACQILANLCTLTLFASYENSPCNLWLESRFSVNPDEDNLNHLPWLIYREAEGNIVLNRKKIPVQYSLNPSLSISKLNLTAVIFNLDGSVKEVKNMLGSDLNLCPNLNHIKHEGLRFGINYEYSCKIDAKQFFQGKRTEFIVPYLQYNEEGKSMLYAVPVLIRNLVQFKNDREDPTNWLLVRRFFMFDTISSIPLKSNEPTIFRYVKSIQIRIKLQSDEHNGKIYPPLLVLEYGEFSKESYTLSEKINFKFSTQYEMKNNIRYPIEITIATLSAFVLLYSGIQTWSFSKRSGKIGIDSLTLLRIILFSCGNLANAFFIIAFGVSVYIFIFFKGQSVVHLLLPTSDQENIIKDFVITAFCLKIVEIIILIWNQIRIDIFLIDWERPRPQDTIPRPKRSASPFTLTTNLQQSVSIWRTYFIANEWNEIQTTRKINLLAHFLIITFILKVLGIEYWGTPDPELHLSMPEYLQNNQLSFICRFAVGSLVYVFVYLVQLIFMIVIYERYVNNAIQQFVDLCSLANISVFIMSLERYGFYIHGRSSHGFADTDMATMLKQLKREEQDLCAYRGLLPGTHNQTFSFGVPSKLRLYYNKLMNPTKNMNLGASISNIGEVSPNKSLDSSKSDCDRISQAYNNLNKFLSAFLEHALKDLDYDVKDKLFVENLLDIEFTECVDRGVLYPDNGHAFDSILFYGNEFCLFTFDLMLFSFVLLMSDDFIVTILSTIFVIEVLKIVRNFGGKRNLAQKTLIDQRFLI